MARKLSEHAELERRRRENDPDGGAVVDMRIDVEFNDSTVLTVGGRWDRRLGDFLRDESGEVIDADTAIVVRPHIGQMPALRWFMAWLAIHAGRRDAPPLLDDQALADLESHLVQEDEVYSALLAGGRRGGKTWFGAFACVLYAVMFPDAIVWVVNPNDKKHDEVRRYMSALIPQEWVSRETQADGWELINGSAIMLKSAYVGADPDAIKEGEANLVWMNEGQKMAKRVYVVARGAIADHSGLVLICANPPVEAKDQQWVGDFASDAQAMRQMSTYINFNPLDNPHINRLALLAMRHELDERTYRIEILGEFLPPAATVAYNWIRTRDGNERARPELNDPYWLDVTAHFLQFEAEEGEGFTDICGMDFQVHPHIGGPVFRIYAPIDEAPTRDNVVMWGVDEIVLEGDEAEWCEEARGRGYENDQTLIIADGTGEYQHTRRSSADSPPPEWFGKGSFDVIRMGGFRHIVPPSRRIRRNNPHVIDRVRALTSMIESASKKRRIFLDPDRCPKTCKSIREWPTTNGKPSRTHEAAHLGDGASYPIVRLFPRILRSPKPGPVDKTPPRDALPRPKNFGSPPAQKRDRPRRERGL